MIGVEREYNVAGPDGIVDARTIWPRLTGLGVALDPGDPNARRGSWGGVITVDGADAEVVTPPVRLQPGCTARVGSLAAVGEWHLRASLPEPLGLRGYSTHISVEVDDRKVVRVARIIAHRLALPLMLALDRADSPGLLVRPRPGRLEICGEFAAGSQLRAAVGLTVGIALLAEQAVGFSRLTCRLPEVPHPRVEPAVERFGYYVDRAAFGPDLYRAGRGTRLVHRRRTVTAGEVLARIWSAARTLAATALGRDELELVDALAAGRVAIPLEGPPTEDGRVAGAQPLVGDGAVARSYAPRIRGAQRVVVESATWWKALLRVDSDAGTRWITIPGRALDEILEAIDSGELDQELAGIGAGSADSLPAAKSSVTSRRSPRRRAHG